MKTSSFLRGLAVLFVLLAGVSFAAGDTPQRPRVGLVLGGGGARGAAHVGVLETLERLHVPVDCVAGTSMGALAAGAFAAGRTPTEMREELAKADWSDMFQDNPSYSEINYRNKATSKRFMPGSETGVGIDGVAYQGGVVAGQKIKLFFNRLVNADLGERDGTGRDQQGVQGKHHRTPGPGIREDAKANATQPGPGMRDACLRSCPTAELEFRSCAP